MKNVEENWSIVKICRNSPSCESLNSLPSSEFSEYYEFSEFSKIYEFSNMILCVHALEELECQNKLKELFELFSPKIIDGNLKSHYYVNSM